MKTFDPARFKWPLWCVGGAGVGLEIGLFYVVTRHAIRAAQAGAPLTGQWSWPSIAGWHLLIALMCGLLVWEPFVQLGMRYDEEGVSRPRFLRSPAYVKWSNVETIREFQLRHKPYVLQINTRDESIEINTLFYKEPDVLLRFIEERMKSCVPEFCR